MNMTVLLIIKTNWCIYLIFFNEKNTFVKDMYNYVHIHVVYIRGKIPAGNFLSILN